MVSKATYIIGAIALVIVVFIGFRITGQVSADNGKYDDFASCLTDSGAKMYGAFWCSHCSDQKKMFGTSWKLVDYVECDIRGEDGNPELCSFAGITSYPTWIFNDGSRASGLVSFEELSFRTGCLLPE